MFENITIIYFLNTFFASFTLSQNVSKQTSKLIYAVYDHHYQTYDYSPCNFQYFLHFKKPPPDGLRNYFPFEFELDNALNFLMSATR